MIIIMYLLEFESGSLIGCSVHLPIPHQMQLIARGFDWVAKFVSISLLGCTSVSSGCKEFKLELTARMNQIS
jgi:hypothetical protein